MSYERIITQNERLYLAAAPLSPPLAVNLVIEGEGQVSRADLERAVTGAAEACPGARLVARGKRWVDTGRAPPVREARFEEALRAPFDPERGPCAEVVVAGDKLLFRAFQGAMDGPGTLLWVRDVFRGLRGESPVGAPATTTDEALVARLGTSVRRRFDFDCSSPFADAVPSSGAFTWHRRSVAGRPLDVLGTLGSVLAAERDVRLMLPMDIRRHAEEAGNTGNLTMPIFLDVRMGEPRESLTARIDAALSRRAELTANDSDGIAGLLPGFGVKAMVKMAMGMQRVRGKYLLASAILSALEPVPLRDLSTPDFRARTLYFLPSHSPLSPVTVVALPSDHGLELTLACAAGEGMEARAEALLTRMAHALAAFVQQPRLSP